MRQQDWAQRLAEYVGAVARTPYQPGVHDCALFVAGAVEVMTGVDHARGLRSKYTTVAGGMKQLKKRGYADHVDFVAQHHEEVPPLTAWQGDIAVVPSPEGDAVGVVQGRFIYVVGVKGVGCLELKDAVRAFRV